MGVIDELARGREAFERRDWAAAYASLAEADGEAPLDPQLLSLWATAAHLLGRAGDCQRVLQRAFREHLDAGGIEPAARCCFWLGMTHMLANDMAVAGGWWGRGWRLLEECGQESVERGFLLIPRAMQQAISGDVAGSVATGRQIEALGRRHRGTDLVAMGLHLQGRGMLHLERVREGMAVLDEAMACVAAGEVTPVLAGMIYCSTIEACQELSDFPRARQWTSALTRWCDTQPDLVPYTGQCAVHRGQIMRLDGSFPAALDELERAIQRYTASGAPTAAGLAFYERGEVHRLRGEYGAAEDAFRQASSRGHDPHPGSALLWLAQGRTGAALAAAARLHAESVGAVRRSAILPALVEIRLAAGDGAGARVGSDELVQIAGNLGCDAISAQAAAAAGMVLLWHGDAAGALGELRRAARIWGSLGAPFDAARARVGLGRACRAVGDEDSARMELEGAAAVFRGLGARPALAEVERLLGRSLPDGLTAREAEVLRLVASGKSNPAIAAELVLSEKTVARHLSNIFTKIEVTSRTAAAAYAFEHRLA